MKLLVVLKSLCTLKMFTKPFVQSQNKLDWQKTIAITSINDAVWYKKADPRFIWILKNLTEER